MGYGLIAVSLFCVNFHRNVNKEILKIAVVKEQLA